LVFLLHKLVTLKLF